MARALVLGLIGVTGIVIFGGLWLSGESSKTRDMLRRAAGPIQSQCEAIAQCPEFLENWQRENSRSVKLTDGIKMYYTPVEVDGQMTAYTLYAETALDTAYVVKGNIGKEPRLFRVGDGSLPDVPIDW